MSGDPSSARRVRTPEEARDWLRARGPRIAAVIDLPAVALAPAAIRDVLRGVAPVRTVTIEPDVAPVGVAELEQLTSLVQDVDAVIAVGGGRTLDAAKLLASGARYLPEQYQGRGGAQYLVAVVPPTPLLAVPTTVGTGAEVSAKAMTATSAARMLLLGDDLRPACRWVVPEVVASLPRAAVAAGGLEILGRLLGPWHGTARPAPAAALARARAVVDAVDTLLSPTGPSPTGPPLTGPADGRRAAATLFTISAQAHLTGGGPVGSPCCYWIWPLATELATVAGVTKMAAVTALLRGWTSWVQARAGRQPQFRLWQEAAIRWGAGPGGVIVESVLDRTLDRVDRYWRPVGPGIPDRPTLGALYGRHDHTFPPLVRSPS